MRPRVPGAVSALIGIAGIMPPGGNVAGAGPGIALTFLFVMNICTGAVHAAFAELVQ